MSDYIKREDALKIIDTDNQSVREDIRMLAYDYREYKYGVDYAYEKIKHDVPAVDAVPVVRCKDCKHRFDGCMIGYPEFFCANGEHGEISMPDTKEDW